MSQQRRTYIFRRLVDVALAAALVFSIASVRAADKGKWIETWAASPQPVWNADFLAPINFPRNLWNQTIRQIARVSVGGSQVRVVLSNEYGSQPLVIGAAHIGLSDSGAAELHQGGLADHAAEQPSLDAAREHLSAFSGTGLGERLWFQLTRRIGGDGGVYRKSARSFRAVASVSCGFSSAWRRTCRVRPSR